MQQEGQLQTDVITREQVKKAYETYKKYEKSLDPLKRRIINAEEWWNGLEANRVIHRCSQSAHGYLIALSTNMRILWTISPCLPFFRGRNRTKRWQSC